MILKQYVGKENRDPSIKLGLWSDKNAIAPWEWRSKKHRN